MYLADRDIKQLLSEIRFETDDLDHPFVPEDQIQPASVDLRLDGTFWRQRSDKVIDLRRSKLLELSPRRHWHQINLKPGECITLKPGEMILGRTFEAFAVPPECAARIEGRSSFGRMGLAVHCTASFINPGWRGRMPLELINFGRSPIRLFPRLPICQLMLVRLYSLPELTYGARELSSKYMDDDGGPSYWWRDKRIKDLHVAMGEHDVSEHVQDVLLEFIGPRDPDLIERFDKYIRKLRHDELTNAEDVLDRFASGESWTRVRAQVYKGGMMGLFPLLAATSLGIIFAPPYGYLHYLVWVATLLSLILFVTGARLDIGDFLTPRSLAESRERIQQQAPE